MEYSKNELLRRLINLIYLFLSKSPVGTTGRKNKKWGNMDISKNRLLDFKNLVEESALKPKAFI